MAINSPLRFWWLTLKDEQLGTLRHIVHKLNDPHTLCKKSTMNYKSGGWCITAAIEKQSVDTCAKCIEEANKVFLNLIKEEPLEKN